MEMGISPLPICADLLVGHRACSDHHPSLTQEGEGRDPRWLVFRRDHHLHPHRRRPLPPRYQRPWRRDYLARNRPYPAYQRASRRPSSPLLLASLRPKACLLSSASLLPARDCWVCHPPGFRLHLPHPPTPSRRAFRRLKAFRRLRASLHRRRASPHHPCLKAWVLCHPPAELHPRR